MPAHPHPKGSRLHEPTGRSWHQVSTTDRGLFSEDNGEGGSYFQVIEEFGYDEERASIQSRGDWESGERDGRFEVENYSSREWEWRVADRTKEGWGDIIEQ